MNFADLWELVAAAVPDRTAVIDAKRRLTFSEVDDRASRLASWMAEQGVGAGSFVGVQMRNSAEFVETSLAAYKIRAVPVNVNFRLRPAELRHLYIDGPLVGVVHDDDLAERVNDVAGDLPHPPWTLVVGAGYEHAITNSTRATPVQRSGDDLYVLYTGGTTGMPKGVVWRIEDAFFGCVGGGDPTGSLGPVERPEQLLDRILDGGAFLPAAPLIHAAGMWTTLRWLLAGVPVVLQPTFSPDEIWRAIAAERVTTMNIVGDAMARPLADALSRCTDLDLTCIRTIASGGAPLTAPSRAQLLNALPDLILKDSYGSSETGVHGWSVHTAENGGSSTRFTVTDTAVLDPDTLAELPTGSNATGVVARRDRVPLRYHGDPAKTAATFRTIGGHRYALTGDLAQQEEDGRITVLGRGSQCINSGGEKIYPEEVEAVLRSHPGIADALVVGVTDELWGQRVTAVVSAAAPRDKTPELAEQLRTHCRSVLAPFKVPKEVVFVDTVQRTAAAKPDYGWAKATAEAAVRTAR